MPQAGRQSRPGQTARLLPLSARRHSVRHPFAQATGLLLVQVFFLDARRRSASFLHAQPTAGREQRATGRRDRGKLSQPSLGHVDVDRLYLAAAEVGFMPEPGAASVPQELLPPLLVRQGAGPALEGVEVTPVL